MDKKDLIKIAVIAIIALFLFETVAIGFLNGQKSDLAEQKTGTADFVISLNSYDKYIVLENKLDEKEIEKIKMLENVKSVSTFSGKTIIESSDPYNTYKELKKIDDKIKGTSNAYFAVEYCAVEGAEKNYKDTVAFGIEPLLKNGVLIKANAPVIYKGNDVLATGQISLNINEKTMTEKAQIISFDSSYYSYSIPWEKRYYAKSLGIEVNNAVYVSKQLNIVPDFVKFQGNGYIIVDENFTDRNSIIELYGNDTVFKNIDYDSKEKLDLDYASETQINIYKAKILSSGEEITYKTSKQLETNSIFEIEVKGVYSGSYLLYLLN